MARKPKATPKPAPKTRAARKPRKQEIEEAAELAAAQAIEEFDTEETFDSPEERDLSLATADFNALSSEEIEERDVFVDAHNKALSRNTRAKYRIYKNGKWVGTKEGRYSWEKLREEFGGGEFKIAAVDRDNQFLGSQTLEVEEPDGWQPRNQPRPLGFEPQVPTHMEFLESMKETRREEEAKARESSNGLASVMSSVMTAITTGQNNMMQMMQESSRQFQTLMLEMNKQSQENANRNNELMLKLLTSDNKKSDAPSAFEMFKMITDASKSAEDRTKMWFELVEKKSNEMAEKKAELMAVESGGEPEESFAKTIVKGFIPIIAKAMQPGMPGMEAVDPNVTTAQMIEAQRQHQAAIAARRDATAAGQVPVGNRRPAQPGTQPSALPPKIGPVNGSAGPARPASPKEAAQAVRGGTVTIDKNKVFDFLKADIGQALMKQANASQTAEACLKKLENSGLARQTVRATFTLEDFYGFAAANGVPDIAKPWIKEFFDHVQKVEPASPPANGKPGAGATTLQSAPSVGN